MPKKIQPATVVAIREAYVSEDQPTYGELADEHDVSVSTVAKIIKGQTYPDAGGPITTEPRRGRKKGKSPGKLAEAV